MGSYRKKGEKMNIPTKNKKLLGFISAAAAFTVLAAGCADSSNRTASENSAPKSNTSESTQADSTTDANISENLTCNTSGIFSDRDLSGEYDTPDCKIELLGTNARIDGSGAVFEDSEIRITEKGTYLITGNLQDGRIVIDTAEKVQLVLDNADINCSDSSPIYAVNADKLFLTMPEGTSSSLSDGSSYEYPDDSLNEPDSCIFSADSLTLNGSGTLNINGNFNEGITSKDDIVIAGCTLNITSVGNGIKGKDYVAVSDAEINIYSESDGIKSTNVTDEGMGFVFIKSGTLNITAANDGIQADNEFICEGGILNVTAGGGSENGETHTDDFGGGNFGGGRNNKFTDETTANADSNEKSSAKGIKAGSALYIGSGEYYIDAADDAIHSNGNLFIRGGEMTLLSGDKGIHADLGADISSGNISIEKSYEGIEAASISVSGGSIDLTSTDDGFNASDGTPQGGMGTYSDNVSLNISGGTVHVNAGGDGLDSNGNMTISGGTVLINGPTNDGNGALDGNGEIICSGGTLIAAGSSGMAEYPNENSTQNTAVITFDTYQDGGTLVTLCNSDGNEVISFAPLKNFNSVIISSDAILSGETYTIYIGGTSTASNDHGLYTVGGYSLDGAEAGTFTAESTLSFIGKSGRMNFGGGHGGMDQMPTNENGQPEIPEKGDFDHHGFGGKGDHEMPTDENGNFAKPDSEDFQPATDENGEFEMPKGEHREPPMQGDRQPPMGDIPMNGDQPQ